MSEIIERPILFNADMVRAILDGQKTQTRRILKIQQPSSDHSLLRVMSKKSESYCWGIRSKIDESMVLPSSCSPIFTPPSGRLWVREYYRPIFGQTCGLIAVDYKADPAEKWERLGDKLGTPEKWRPSIHMPRSMSRITLEITNVRVERLQDITDEDAIAEGVYQRTFNDPDIPFLVGERRSDGFETVLIPGVARAEFLSLWADIYGQKSLDSNPWIWVIEFKQSGGV